jgi:anti-sigma factor RsiW
MNCTQFQDILHDLAGNARLDEMTRQNALAHADACPRCDERLAEARWVTGALRSLAAQDGTAEAPSHVEEVVRSAFRRNQGLVVRSAGSLRWTLASVASLAAAVIFSVLLLHHPGTPGPKLSDGRSASALNQSLRPQSGVVSQPENRASKKAALGNAKANATVRRVVPHLDESARAFVPLPFSEASMLPEDEVVVRMSVPPSALSSFGIPVSDVGRDEDIFADFIVGEDGTPRAVRVVN